MGAYPQIVDWNADGKIDLAVGDSYGKVTLFLNTGSAGNPILTPQGMIQAAGADLDVGDRAAPVFVDWNNDGKKDLVIGNHYPGEIRLYLNNGTNSAPVFTTYTTLQADGNPLNEVAACPEVWDLDGDGRKDLLVSSYSGGVTFYKNIGADANPVLAAGEKIQAGGRELQVGNYARLDLADWDADGDKDLLVGDWDGYVTLFLNQMPSAAITLTAPNGGENWAIGSSQVITWTHTGALSQVKVELSRHNGAAWETLAASTPNDGSEAWTVTGPAATTCRIRISDLDGSPSDQSDAAFTIYQLETIAVTAPNGGEIWNVNSSQNITWNSSGNFANVKIELSRDYGSSWETLVATTPNDGAQTWQVTGPGAAACLMRIADVDGSPVDQSDRSFSIYQPETITITTPNGGENWAIGSSQSIQWTTTGAVGNVKIELTRNNGANWETLFVSTFNRGAQSWTVTGPAATACRLRISDVDGAPMDQSDATFTIYQPQTLTITAPNGNETWAIGSSQDITWTSAGAVGNVKIELSRNQGATWESLFTNTANDGVQSWLVTGPAAASCLVRISEVDGAPVDQSNAAFTIYQPETITLTAPNGDETWAIGSNQNIQWTSIGNFSNVKIEISRNNGLSWETLFAASPNDGAQTWAVTGPTGAACRLRIADVDGSPVDQSDGAFTIFQPESITLLAPNGGENWALGSSQNISWTSTGAVGNVKIEISRNNAVSWEMLWADTPNDGLESWQVTGSASATCRVRITDVDGNPTAQSVRTFAIYQPESITITAPNGGENWQVGSMQNITWVSTGVSAQVNIELTRDQGFTWEVLFAGVPNDGLQPWVVTVPVGYNCRLRISDVDGSIADLSDAMFTIFQAEMLSVTVPNGSENWAIGSNVTLTWSAAGTSGNLKIEISRNNSATWEVLFASTPDDGNQSWLVTGPATTTASVRISDVDGSVSDQSDAGFTIYQPDLISIRTPNGGEDWLIGTEQHITWAATGAFNAVNIELSRDRGTTWELLFENTANDFDQPWQVTGPATLEALIRISDTDGTPTAASQQPFQIYQQPQLHLTSPNGGESWQVGVAQAIVWQAAGIAEKIKVEFSKDAGRTWVSLGTFPTNANKFVWTPQAHHISNQAWIKLTDFLNRAFSDQSDAPFSIIARPQLQVTPTWLDFDSTQTQLSFEIRNAVGSGLNWQMKKPAEMHWVTEIRPTQGQNNATILLTIERTGLTPGHYSGQLSVLSNGGNQVISLNMVVPVPVVQHFVFKKTESFYPLMINQVTLDGVMPACGDEVAVYTPAGLCVGAAVWNGLTPLFLNAWQDSPTTPDQIDGYQSGEKMYFYFWDVSAGQANPYSARPYFAVGDTTFGYGSFSHLTRLEASSTFNREGLSRVDGSATGAPVSFFVTPNYPNPFNPETTWRYGLPYSARVSIQIFNAQGQWIATLVDDFQLPGYYEMRWYAPDIPTGIYFCRIQVGAFSKRSKFLLLK